MMDDLRWFVELVIEMRDAQKSYYRTHARGDLHRALELEKRVDVALLQLANGVNRGAEPVQARLGL